MNTFRIKKKSGTYSELLEVYGLANTIHKIFEAINESDAEIIISDKNLYYELTTNMDIKEEILNSLNYFWLFKYIKQKNDSNLTGIIAYYDYPTQKAWRKERNDALQKMYKEYQGKDKKNERENRIEEIESIYNTQKRIDFEYDVYSQLISDNFSGFNKVYENISKNRENFSSVIKLILNNYCDGDLLLLDNTNLKLEQTITAIQLYNPNQGKGLKSLKANSVAGGNFKCSWISEAMKISGALSDMICQLVKVGSSYDLKVFVPEYKQVNYGFKGRLIPDFKKYMKGNTPIKIDILNVLLLTQKVLQNSEYSGRRKNVKDVVAGFHSVYQKNMGQKNAVMNIGFIQVPNFIEIGNKEENLDWIDILEDQKKIIGSMDENKGALQGLKLYRNFISGSDIESFFDFSFWYAAYLSSKLSNKQYAKAFTIESLNKFYNCMDTQNLKLMEIIENKGFQAVAKAIRESTVNLQINASLKKKGKANDFQIKQLSAYTIRYGVAQTLQTKSKSSEDLAAFIGEFISTYNAETARYAEKNGESLRSNVREDELCDFFTLLDKYSSRLVGALLASYGFALKAKYVQSQDDDENDDLKDNTDEE